MIAQEPGAGTDFRQMGEQAWHGPAADWEMTVARGRVVVARCAWWWTSVPRMNSEPVGVIGQYDAPDAATGSSMLLEACRRLAAAGCAWAVGPMDGTTWRSYRLVTHQGTEPPFFLEPWTPPEWVCHWTAAGFESIAEYTSAVDDLTREDGRATRASERLHEAGIRIRCFNAAEPESDLRQMFALSLQSFETNFLFAPISEAEFLERTRALLPVIRPELVLLAVGPRDTLEGYLFAIPDILRSGHGLPIDTVIIKTVAVARRRAVAGLGGVLVAHARRVARELGYRRAIHALMHTRNVSTNISRRYASPFRRYALFGRRLAA